MAAKVDLFKEINQLIQICCDKLEANIPALNYILDKLGNVRCDPKYVKFQQSIITMEMHQKIHKKFIQQTKI